MPNIAVTEIGLDRSSILMLRHAAGYTLANAGSA